MNEASPPHTKPSLKHELRTPLNHIIGYCEMLTEEAQDRGLGPFLPDLERIHAAGRRLLSVINEICDPDKLPLFQANPSLLDHDVRTPLNQIIGYAEMLQEDAKERGESAMVPDLERIHAAARELLRRITAHFAPPLLAKAEPGRDAAQESTTVFRRNVPRPAAADKPAPVGKLLVVDDDEDNRAMLRRRLERLGHQVALAANGREALESLRTNPFDLLLLDIQMPELNGYEVLELMKRDGALADVPVIVLSASDEVSRVARCIEMGADDYLPKPFDPVLLKARIGACLEKKQLRERERAAFEALQKNQKALSEQLAEAARYVRSLLPAPITSGPVRADWRFQPCDALGGDAFNYHWLDDGHFAFYLMDVCGHGVGAALLSVSVMNVLNNQSVPGVDFRDPGAVLAALNRTFTMEKQNNMYFTIWYGVLAVERMELAYACGGHPPAILRIEGSPPRSLAAPGAIVGFIETPYETRRQTLPRGSRLHVFSDGVYELACDDGRTLQLPEFISQLAAPVEGSKLDQVLQWATGIRAGAGFEDDFSILEISLA